ncbi:MAG: methyltransferase domain-containing protein, partial [Ktedonobacterales bacterium]|nr:methyltransferase domain-containing protein [Ktedonobacterales bacterium]
MHSFARSRHDTTSQQTKGLLLNGGIGYDINGSLLDFFAFRGQWRALRQRTIALAQLQIGEHVLDVGCGTGTLAIAAQRLVGKTGQVAGVDPSAQQIDRARRKATRRHLPITFQSGVIEQLTFPEQTFAVVFST